MAFNTVWIPDKNQLKSQYNEFHAHFTVLLKRLEDHLRATVKVSALLTYKTRVKSFDSYYKKLLKFPPTDPAIRFPLVTDLIGIRIVCPFLQNLSEVENILIKNFTVRIRLWKYGNY